MDHVKLAQECVRLVGGTDNICTMAHCATRLRLQLLDKGKAQIKALEKLEGVLGVKEVGAQTQIIIGPGVPKVYKEIEKITGGKQGQKDGQLTQKGSIAATLLDTVTGIFAPVINAITAAGMVKAFLLILGIFGLSSHSQEYYILNFVADSAFYFLPVLLAFSSAQKFGCNPYIAAVVGGVLLHPNWSALVSGAQPVTFFHIPVTLWSYSSSVLPIILTVLFMSYVERFAEKYSPNVVKAILRPLITLGITAPVALIVIGPLGSYMGRIFALVISFLDTNLPVLVPTIVGAVFPLLVFVGMHLAIFPALQTMQLADMGYETVCGPGVLASNFAVAGATLAVAVRNKNAGTREMGISTGVTALCGITEPALYGIVVKFKYPLTAAIIGGGAGGLFAGISHLKRYALATPGIPSLPIYIGEDPTNIFKALITLVIGFTVAFAVSWFLAGRDAARLKSEPDVKHKADASIKLTEDSGAKTAAERVQVYSPVCGTVIPAEQIKDAVFAGGVLGAGCGIEPDSDTVCAPFDGVVAMVADTKHAIGLTDTSGIELLIHVGIDTVDMDGDGFEVLCKAGDTVTRGQKLLIFDRRKIEEAGHPDTVAVFVTNTYNYSNVVLEKTGPVGTEDRIITAE